MEKVTAPTLEAEGGSGLSSVQVVSLRRRMEPLEGPGPENGLRLTETGCSGSGGERAAAGRSGVGCMRLLSPARLWWLPSAPTSCSPATLPYSAPSPTMAVPAAA